MSDILRYNRLQDARVKVRCAYPSCNVAIRAGSSFCPSHWQRDLVHRIACYKHNVGCVLKVSADIADYRTAWQIALFASDSGVAGFVLRELTKDLQARLCVSDVDLDAIRKMVEVAA